MNSKCPTCSHRLEETSQAERRLVKGKKFDDEDIYWCPRCKEYILEEDILFNEE